MLDWLFFNVWKFSSRSHLLGGACFSHDSPLGLSFGSAWVPNCQCSWPCFAFLLSLEFLRPSGNIWPWRKYICIWILMRAFWIFLVAFPAESRQKQIIFLLSCSLCVCWKTFSPCPLSLVSAPEIPISWVDFFPNSPFYITDGLTISHQMDTKIQPLGNQGRTPSTGFSSFLPLWFSVPFFPWLLEISF